MYLKAEGWEDGGFAVAGCPVGVAPPPPPQAWEQPLHVVRSVADRTPRTIPGLTLAPDFLSPVRPAPLYRRSQ